MAYLVGLVTREEEKRLIFQGYKVEKYTEKDSLIDNDNESLKLIKVYVPRSIEEILNFK